MDIRCVPMALAASSAALPAARLKFRPQASWPRGGPSRSTADFCIRGAWKRALVGLFDGAVGKDVVSRAWRKVRRWTGTRGVRASLADEDARVGIIHGRHE